MKKLLLLAGVILFYVGWWSYAYVFTTPTITEIVKNGKIEDVESTKAYVIRDELLMTANGAGNLYPIAQEGEKIAKGSKIASLYRGKIDPAIQERLKAVNERITDITNSQINTEIFAGDLVKLESQIDKKVSEAVSMAYENKLSGLSRVKEELNTYLEKKQTVSGQKGPAGNNLEALKKEKESYESQLNAEKTDIYASEAGSVSYNIDGMEQSLNPGKMSTYMPADFDMLDKLDQKKNNTNIVPGQPVLKIIQSHEWYIGAVLDTKDIHPVQVGSDIVVRFPDYNSEEANGNVVFISKESKGKAVVVIMLDKYIDQVFSSRRVNIDIVKQSFSGLKIPRSAIHVKDGGKQGVFILKESVAKFREVDVIDYNNDYMIVKEDNTNQKSLLLYDQVIVKGKDIYEDKLILNAN